MIWSCRFGFWYWSSVHQTAKNISSRGPKLLLSAERKTSAHSVEGTNRNDGVLSAGAGTRAAPLFPLSPLGPLLLRFAPDRFSLTKTNTSCTIDMPASLRSEGVRDPPGIPFGIIPESRSASPESLLSTKLFSWLLESVCAREGASSVTRRIKVEGSR
jgi:hypothetical protein